MVRRSPRKPASADRIGTRWPIGLVLASLAILGHASAADAACKGRDLLAEMRTAAPQDYAQIDSAALAMPFAEGRLFKITREGVAPSFLFGTLHVIDPRLASLSARQLDALRSAKTVALETLDFEKGASSAITRTALGAAPAERASKLLQPDAFARLKALTASRGFPTVLADRLKASALALMLDLPACAEHGSKGSTFLDAQVLAAARRRGLVVVALESTVEQVSIADSLSAENKTALLTAVLAQSQQADSVVETTVTVYLQGRIGLLLAWTASPRPIPGVAQAGIPSAFLDRIVASRTRRMRDRVLPSLTHGGVFIAIGATHIPGKDGLAALLAEAGYTVEKIE